jgi:hypothetical protein
MIWVGKAGNGANRERVKIWVGKAGIGANERRGKIPGKRKGMGKGENIYKAGEASRWDGRYGKRMGDMRKVENVWG